MTLDEIQADKDRMRAEFAMSARRLEMSAQALRDKNAAQIVEIGRGHEEIKALNSVISEKNRYHHDPEKLASAIMRLYAGRNQMEAAEELAAARTAR